MKNSIITIFACLVIAMVSLADETPRTERVQFEKGKSEATIKSKIRGYEEADYLLWAGAGQTMDISLVTSHSATYFNVFAPGMKPGRDAAFFIGETGGKHFNGKLTIPGDYIVQVFMMRSAARRNETAQYTVNVRILGVADRSVKSPEPGPWPVDTDASGDLPCSKGGKDLDLHCPFKVKRNSYGATIWAIKPGETRDPKEMQLEDLRTLYFEKLDNKVNFSTNDSSKASWEREDDNWIVTVGEHERYWILDAVIYGG